MAFNVRKLIASGYERAYWSVMNGNYAWGYDLVGPTSGASGQGARRLDGVLTSNVQIADPDIVEVPGDDTVLGEFIFPPGKLPNFVLETSTHDMDLEALSQGTLVEDDGDISFGVLQPLEFEYPDLCLVLARRGRSRSAATYGQVVWEGIILPHATMIPLGGNEFGTRAVAKYRYRVSVNPSGFYPWGKALTMSNVGTVGAPIITWSAQHRLHIHSHLGDGTTTTFNLGYTPASASLSKCRTYVNGVLTLPASVDPTLKSFTQTVAPSALASMVTVYESKSS